MIGDCVEGEEVLKGTRSFSFANAARRNAGVLTDLPWNRVNAVHPVSWSYSSYLA